MSRFFAAFAPLVLLSSALAQDPPSKPDASATLAGLKLRSLGPAVTSGRIVALAVHPTDRATYYAGAASGGVWKTVNAGTTWTPIFDNEGSYSIGAVVLDPKNPNVVWVGSGECNSQRSVGYGDGVYRSDDGGKTWKNVGLKQSEHIGRIVIDPRDSNVVYVAAQGPLWGPGGDRGLYKTSDGGKSWRCVLAISENTGVTDVVLDPRNPNVLLAAAYQRRRHVWTLINGGPESAIYKSTDAGVTWNKLTNGLPAGDLGRIGLAIAPTNPDLVYATVEAAEKKGGIFRSADQGVTWERRNEFDQQAQYYAQISVDPVSADRIYVMNVYIQVSDDGGKTLRRLGERFKHVDSHAMWVDPRNPNYYLVGCDGGIYESFDRAATWKFVSNLPITQFYDIAVDNAYPFYNVYGGTQDNFTLGGPSRTRSLSGITNADWFVVLGGDGFHCKVDPNDPDIVYAEYQYAGLSRFDRRTGQSLGIKPMEGKGEPPLRWNWDSPLVLSPHAPTRLYFAANKVFRSDDRGNSWKAISPDLTRQLDRDQLPVMGKIWGPDTVAKHVSTSFYGNIVALAEAPKKEGLLYAGTDDGLIQVSENGGGSWRKIEKFDGVPERSYVSRLLASQHDANTVYASFDNHKMADFAPYLLKSTDAGQTWTSLKANLPANGPVLALAEDHVQPNLLFVGTEFGLYFTVDGGKKWVRLKSGLPTIAVRDLAIHRRMNDLVVGTFGRGIYVLDDYSALRDAALLESKESHLFPIREALQYVPTRPYGGRSRGFQGEAFYAADNPPLGASLSYYLKESLKTRKQKRKDVEAELIKKGLPVAYPTPEQLRAEEEEEPPAIILSIADTTGRVVRTLTGPVTAGVHRLSWDLREPSVNLPRPRTPDGDDPFAEESTGPFVLPGMYRVTTAKRVEGKLTSLDGLREFAVVADAPERATAEDRKALLDFQHQMIRLQKAVNGTVEVANSVTTRLEQVRRAADSTPSVPEKVRESARVLEQRNREILRSLRGDPVLRGRNYNTPPSITERVGQIVGEQYWSLSRPTKTHLESFKIASEELTEQLAKLRTLLDVDLKTIEKALDLADAPWTPGRLPEWKEK